MPYKPLRPQSLFNDPCADAYTAAALGLSRLAAMENKCVLDIPYGEDPDQRLDIFLPSTSDAKPLPVYVNIHGGGWTHGYKEWMGLNAPPLIAAPSVYVSVAYRLAPEHRHPAQIEDCLNALAWIYKNISSFGASPQRIHIGGHSAGGHLAALAALRRDLYPKFGLPPDLIQTCFPFCGIYNLTDRAIHGVPESAHPNPILAHPRDARDASPIAFVTGNKTPFFVSWAQNDNPVCKAAGPAFAAALAREPGYVKCHEFPDFDHFWMHIDQQRKDNLWTRTLVDWMNSLPSG